MKLSEELVLVLRRAGAGTETPRIPGWLSQPPPSPKYQPSPAKAGVLKAAAATVAMASKRSFIFLPSLKIQTGRDPPPIYRNQCSAYNDGPGKCLHAICCFAADKRSISKVLVRPCDS